MSSRTVWDTVTVLPAADFVTLRVTAGLPLTLEYPLVGSFTTATVATSAMVGAVSARAPSSGRAAISSVLAMREPDCTVSVWESCVIAPLASSVPLAVRAVLID